MPFLFLLFHFMRERLTRETNWSNYLTPSNANSGEEAALMHRSASGATFYRGQVYNSGGRRKLRPHRQRSENLETRKRV